MEIVTELVCCLVVAGLVVAVVLFVGGFIIGWFQEIAKGLLGIRNSGPMSASEAARMWASCSTLRYSALAIAALGFWIAGIHCAWCKPIGLCIMAIGIGFAWLVMQLCDRRLRRSAAQGGCGPAGQRAS